MLHFTLEFRQCVEHLGHAVDLVVVLAVREGGDLVQELLKPGRGRGQAHLSILQFGGLRRHALHLIGTGIQPPGLRYARAQQLLPKADAARCVLDHDQGGLPFLPQRTGSDFDAVGIVWQYRWGDGL